MKPTFSWPAWFIRPRRPSHPSAERPIPPAVRLVLGLAMLVTIGTLVLMLPISATGDSLSFDEALFTATSALTVTGLATIIPGSDLTLFGQIVLLVLIQIGGVGFMVVTVVLLRLLGRKISLQDRLTLTDSLGLLVPGAIVKLTRNVLATVLMLEGLGALLLYLHWRTDERLTEAQAAFFAIFHAVSAFCNAGFDLFTGLPGYPEGIPRDSLSLMLLGLLIFIGGLGIPVIADLLAYRRRHHFSLHTRITLGVSAFLLFCGTLGFFLAEGRLIGALNEESLGRRLLTAWFAATAARTAGFAAIPDLNDLTGASQVLMMTLMFIGCPPASMGGGITTGTFAILSISFWSFARGLPAAQFGGRSFAVGTVRKAAAVLTVALFLVLLATWLILMTHDAPVHVVIFEVISAFATCGLSLGLTGDLNFFGQLVIILVMFWGRLGALTIVIALAQQQGKPQPLVFPEEQILIG
jgi:trk system potassium uptake protein TrkH